MLNETRPKKTTTSSPSAFLIKLFVTYDIFCFQKSNRKKMCEISLNLLRKWTHTHTQNYLNHTWHCFDWSGFTYESKAHTHTHMKKEIKIKNSTRKSLRRRFTKQRHKFGDALDRSMWWTNKAENNNRTKTKCHTISYVRASNNCDCHHCRWRSFFFASCQKCSVFFHIIHYWMLHWQVVIGHLNWN